jgi:dihydrofolate reductase
MRRLILWNVITLDGLFEGEKHWDLPWHEQIWGEELEQFSIEQLRSADGLVFGRVTYEGMARHWRSAHGEIADYMNALPKHVFSRTLHAADWENSAIVAEEPAIAIPELKRQGDGNLFVFGSADLSSTLVKAQLYDEYRIAIAPVIHGAGRPLFEAGLPHQRLAFLESRALSNGCVILRYAPASVALTS